MEIPLSQEYINMPEEYIRCQNEVLDRALLGKVSSSVQVSSSRLTTHDLQLRKVISSSSELRFGVLELYGKPIESRVHSYKRIEDV